MKDFGTIHFHSTGMWEFTPGPGYEELLADEQQNQSPSKLDNDSDVTETSIVLTQAKSF